MGGGMGLVGFYSDQERSKKEMSVSKALDH
jgi:hypothetical protein